MDWDILMPLGVCVVLPVMIVWLVMRTRQNETNKKTEIMLKAIEAGATIDADFFKAQYDQRAPKTMKEKLLKNWGLKIMAVLISFLVWFLVANIEHIPATLPP